MGFILTLFLSQWYIKITYVQSYLVNESVTCSQYISICLHYQINKTRFHCSCLKFSVIFHCPFVCHISINLTIVLNFLCLASDYLLISGSHFTTCITCPFVLINMLLRFNYTQLSFIYSLFLVYCLKASWWLLPLSVAFICLSTLSLLSS